MNKSDWIFTVRIWQRKSKIATTEEPLGHVLGRNLNNRSSKYGSVSIIISDGEIMASKRAGKWKLSTLIEEGKMYKLLRLHNKIQGFSTDF